MASRPSFLEDKLCFESIKTGAIAFLFMAALRLLVVVYVVCMVATMDRIPDPTELDSGGSHGGETCLDLHGDGGCSSAGLVVGPMMLEAIVLVFAGGAGVREKEIRGSGGSLEPPGHLLAQLHTVYTAYSECLPTT